MRIAILTSNLADNSGTALQAISHARLLDEAGHEVKILLCDNTEAMKSLRISNGYVSIYEPPQ